MEALAKLRPAFANGLPQPQDATVTAGNASVLADGAAALLLCRADTAKSLGMLPYPDIMPVLFQLNLIQQHVVMLVLLEKYLRILIVFAISVIY